VRSPPRSEETFFSPTARSRQPELNRNNSAPRMHTDDRVHRGGVYNGSWYVPQIHAISNGSVWIDIVNGVDCRCVDDYLGGYCYSPSGW
jgi:hypothetical protein